ncbi:MAG TPA: cupin domain-containing protein [Dehalococcoidia bacterium]|nr:cupin domain-containing protein [Dehalococcoidia bacterium]
MRSENENPFGDLFTYERWQREEGIPSYGGYYIQDLNALELKPWPRKEALGAFINLEGTGNTNDGYVCEIQPGATLPPQRHMFEELIFVLEGRGSTTVWYEDGQKRTVQWRRGSLFAVPLNAWHQHANGSPKESARYFAVTSAPLMIQLFHSREFIFDNPYVFQERFNGQDDFFSTEGKLYPGRVWECNFIPDVASFELMEWKERGAGGGNVMFEIAEGALIAHISEFPVGTYKKAHRHGPGAHVTIISGSGYSLMWPENGERIRIDWQPGSVLVPPNDWFHQHFNTGPTPARYLALRWGSKKYRVPLNWEVDTVDRDVRAGGAQIEYEDEDPEIRRMFEADLAKAGVELRMPPVTAGQR